MTGEAGTKVSTDTSTAIIRISEEPSITVSEIGEEPSTAFGINGETTMGATRLSGVALIGLAGGMLAGAAYTALRKLSNLEGTTTILLYFGAMTMVVSAPAAVLNWVWPPTQVWFALGTIGCLSAAAQVLMTKGYRILEAAGVGQTFFRNKVGSGPSKIMTGHPEADLESKG